MLPPTRLPACLLALAALCLGLPAAAFDATHARWDALVEKHVTWQAGGHESKVDYAGFQQDRAALKVYLAELSAVDEAQFHRWRKADRLAFLINAYNAYTVELVLTGYPELSSIRDLGSLFTSPWKKAFVPLLGRQRSLDDIEHGMIRAPGAYDDPRIHMAVNCASIGCPALRPEAYAGDRLDAQLDDQVKRFLGDRTRNRYDAQSGRLRVSRIFDWYGDDFRRGHGGIDSLEGFFARHAALLADPPAQQQAIRERKAKITFLDYDWALNDRRD